MLCLTYNNQLSIRKDTYLSNTHIHFLPRNPNIACHSQNPLRHTYVYMCVCKYIAHEHEWEQERRKKNLQNHNYDTKLSLVSFNVPMKETYGRLKNIPNQGSQGGSWLRS